MGLPALERKARDAIAQGVPPHDALRLAFRDRPPPASYPARVWTGPQTHHALANAAPIRLHEPNVPDVHGAKYTVVDDHGHQVCPPMPLLACVRLTIDRKNRADRVVVIGSERPVVEWGQPWAGRGQTRGTCLRAHPVGVSTAELAALKRDAPDMSRAWQADEEVEVWFRIRIRPSLRRRVQAAAEWAHECLNEPGPRSRYVTTWVQTLLLEAVTRSEQQRERARVAQGG